MKIRSFIRRVSDFALGHRALMSGAAFILAIELILTVVNAPAVVGASATQRSLPIYSVERDGKYVALSFDAAWGNEDTQQLIDILNSYNVKATFFIVGEWVDKYPESVMQLHEAGIPTVVWLCPILPFINDTEENLRGILDYCVRAGVYGIICFGMGLTLREGNREYFFRQLDRLFPGLKEKYIRLYGNQYEINSPNGRSLMALFHRICEENQIVHDNGKIFEYLKTFEEKPESVQLSLFD